ncbi:MAG: histidinol-phosphate aminotransferase [Verrucomicrobiales bacterium]|jgi:histidinol-phosphate aminotransferase
MAVMIGRVRPAVLNLASYRPGKAASQIEDEHGIEDAIKLASNENPWSPAPAVIDAIVEAASGVNRYADNNASEVRVAIGEWLGVDVSRITVGCGSSGLLQQLFMTFVDPGDEVIFPWPSFEIYPVFSTLCDAVDVRVALDSNFAFDLDAVAEAVTDRTKVIFLATPNNPTGSAISMDEVNTLLHRIPDDVIVVIDEAYREFSDASFGDPIVDLQPTHPNLVVTRTFSKAFGLAGLRSGYGVADPSIIEQLDKVRLAFSVNNLAQAGMLAAIEHEAAALKNVTSLVTERDRCIEALANAGVETPPAHGNFVFIPTGAATEEIAIAMEKQGLVTRPFAGFGLRVTIGSPEQNDRWLEAFFAAR